MLQHQVCEALTVDQDNAMLDPCSESLPLLVNHDKCSGRQAQTTALFGPLGSIDERWYGRQTGHFSRF